MKIDRLIGLTTYLMNRGVVSAAALAARFEVSKRTIQRDIEALNLAGIPIVSAHGAGGGYQILDGFRLTKQIAGAKDYRNIITALRGLNTAFDDRSIEETLDKALATMQPAQQRVFVDLAAAREGSRVDEHLRVIGQAIDGETPLRLQYTGAQGDSSERVVEPLALTYRWYAWYLLGFCRLRQGYRLFKLPRIAACEALPGGFSRRHGPVEALLRTVDAGDRRERSRVRILCRGEIRQQALEYLGTNIVEEREDGDFVIELHVPFERMWFSLILGFGDEVEVLEPEAIREKVRRCAVGILSVYE